MISGQGEQDRSLQSSEYQDLFYEFINAADEQSWMSGETPVLVMEFRQIPKLARINRFHGSQDERADNIWTAESDGLGG